MKLDEPTDQFSADLTTRRFDEVVRRMVNTPPQPHRGSSSALVPERQSQLPRIRSLGGPAPTRLPSLLGLRF